MPFQLKLLRVLWALDHTLNARSKQMGKTHGLTGPQRMALRLVALSPGMSSGELAETLHLHPSTLTGILERLARRGLLDRKRDPFDARRALLRVTPAGLRLLEHKKGTIEEDVRRALSKESKVALKRAFEVLQRITLTLDESARH
jgi:MarR family transcriptional regulator, organic hydroperoxide resistance regulator